MLRDQSELPESPRSDPWFAGDFSGSSASQTARVGDTVVVRFAWQSNQRFTERKEDPIIAIRYSKGGVYTV
jgi:hypothetical protein